MGPWCTALPAPTGRDAFVACSCWLVEAYAFLEQVDHAGHAEYRLEKLGNNFGILAEEIDPVTGEGLGNLPQETEPSCPASRDILDPGKPMIGLLGSDQDAVPKIRSEASQGPSVFEPFSADSRPVVISTTGAGDEVAPVDQLEHRDA